MRIIFNLQNEFYACPKIASIDGRFTLSLFYLNEIRLLFCFFSLFSTLCDYASSLVCLFFFRFSILISSVRYSRSYYNIITYTLWILINRICHGQTVDVSPCSAHTPRAYCAYHLYTKLFAISHNGCTSMYRTARKLVINVLYAKNYQRHCNNITVKRMTIMKSSRSCPAGPNVLIALRYERR